MNTERTIIERVRVVFEAHERDQVFDFFSANKGWSHKFYSPRLKICEGFKEAVLIVEREISNKTFLVAFSGSYLGGEAVVRAATPEEAINVAKGHEDAEPWMFDGSETVTEIETKNEAHCLHFNGGDY